MFLSVREMEFRPLTFRETLEPGKIEFFDSKLLQISDLQASGRAELVGGTEEIHVRGHLKVEMQAGCDRCLEVMRIPVDQEFDLIYVPDISEDMGDEVEIKDGDAEIGFYEGNGMELLDILREQVLLAMPMQIVCRQDCKGLCPVCGRNRNQVDCGCHVEVADDRWSALKHIRKSSSV